MTTKRALELVARIKEGETLPRRSYNAFKKFMETRSLEWINEHTYSDHYARARGYQASGLVTARVYQGRFGFGFVISYPNNTSTKPSNQYRDIEYRLF